MKLNYSKYGNSVTLFIITSLIITGIHANAEYRVQHGGDSEPIQGWSDNFDDGNYLGWEIFGMNSSATPPKEIPGEYTAQDGFLEALGPEWNHARTPSNITQGTWSFDILAADSPNHHFYVYFMIKDAKEIGVPPDGYGIMVVTKEWVGGRPGFLLMKYLDGEFIPIKGYMTEDDVSGWCHIDVTRVSSGLMQVYLNGALIISASDLSFNESEYFHVNLQSGQAIDNIEIHEDIQMWSDDFNDGNYDEWQTVFGEWKIINGAIQGQQNTIERPYCVMQKPSNITYGTWSFDVKFHNQQDLYISFIDDNGTFGTYGYFYELKIDPRGSNPSLLKTDIILYKQTGSHSETSRVINSKSIPNIVDETWHHIDILRNVNGKFSIYLDNELLFQVTDNDIVTSKVFGIVSEEYGAYIDNIKVSQVTGWSDNFDDVNLEGWTQRWGNWSATNKFLELIAEPEYEGLISHPSTLSYGTWSLDVYLEEDRDVIFFFIANNHTYNEGGYVYFFEIKPDIDFNILAFAKVTGDPEGKTVFTKKRLYKTIIDKWQHIDITRDTAGRFRIYLDTSLVIDVTDNELKTSEYFSIVSQEGTFIDNVYVSNIIDLRMPESNDVSVDIPEEPILQGEDLNISVEIKDALGEYLPYMRVSVNLHGESIPVSEVNKGVHKTVIDTSDLLGKYKIVISVESYGVMLFNNSYLVEVVSPANFEISDLSINPNSILVGESSKITVKVANTGGLEGAYRVVLKMNNAILDEKNVIVDANQTKSIDFTYVSSESGTHSVDVNGLIGSLDVKQPGISGWSDITILLGLLLCIIYLKMR